jgi:hypothetical protein
MKNCWAYLISIHPASIIPFTFLEVPLHRFPAERFIRQETQTRHKTQCSLKSTTLVLNIFRHGEYLLEHNEVTLFSIFLLCNIHCD